MRIIQISDVHIRNLKYHPEYREVFQDLYRWIDKLKPDLVVNTGDTAHTKTQISPEFVQMASEHIREVRKRAPYHIILGNHDLNLMNPGRQDAISPIVESLRDSGLFLHKKSGRVQFAPGFNFWVFSLADQENYPIPSDWRKFSSDVNIGLFHGSVSNCVTDSNWRMTHVEHDLSIFDGLDYVMMGDIHKQQFFDGNKIAYPGSLIQQNFGEELEKGFLFWEIENKHDFKVTPINLKGGKKFITLRLGPDLGIPETEVSEGNRLRIVPPRQITLVEQKAIEKEVKKRFKPHDVITLSAVNVGNSTTETSTESKVSHENLREISVQEKLLREHFQRRGDPVTPEVLQLILDLNRRYQIHIDQRDDTARNVSWKFNKVMWSNLFNYGENNVIDFSQLGGLTGIFAPNASGKSNLIDILLETCFDATTKGVNKNIFLINDNKDNAVAMADISANDQKYTIERTIERIKYGQRSRDQVKEWGKTSVSFAKVDEAGQELLAGTLRPETERNIRQRLGTFDDFLLTSLSAQWNPLDIISCKETKRREILYRFLDLDVCEQKVALAKEEAKPLINKLKDLDEQGIEDEIKKHRNTRHDVANKLTAQELMKASHEATIKKIDEQILELSGQKVKIDSGIKPVRDSEIHTVKLIIAEKESFHAELLEKLAEAENAVAKLDKLESRFDLRQHEEKEARYNEINGLLQELREDILDYQKLKKNHEKNVSLLAEVPCGDSFPTCKFLVNAFASKDRIVAIGTDVAKTEEEIKKLEAEAQELRPSVERLEQYRKFAKDRSSLESQRDHVKLRVENARLKVDGYQRELKELQERKARFEQAAADFKKNQELDDQIADRQKDKRQRMNDLKTLQGDINAFNKLLGIEQGALDKLLAEEAKLNELRNSVTAYEFYIQAMGKDGIPYQILTQKLPLINEEINKILANAADFSVFIEHDAEEQSIRLYLQYGQYKSRLLELGSGAEKFLASIAIRCALLNISNLPKTNLFVIDEGFGKLDLKNLEAVQRMFDYLKSVFDHVWIISHLDVMKDMVDNVIEISSDDEGYAHIEVGS